MNDDMIEKKIIKYAARGVIPLSVIGASIFAAGIYLGVPERPKDGYYERHENGDETDCVVTNETRPAKTWITCRYGSGMRTVSLDGKLTFIIDYIDNNPIRRDAEALESKTYVVADIPHNSALTEYGRIISRDSSDAKRLQKIHDDYVNRLIHDENLKPDRLKK